MGVSPVTPYPPSTSRGLGWISLESGGLGSLPASASSTPFIFHLVSWPNDRHPGAEFSEQRAHVGSGPGGRSPTDPALPMRHARGGLKTWPEDPRALLRGL